jgi:hypothetical protein
VKIYGVGVDEIETAAIDKRELLAKKIRKPEIVAVEKCDELAAGHSQAGISRGAGALVWLAKVSDEVRVGFEVSFQFFSVWRAIVDNDDLVVSKRLGED